MYPFNRSDNLRIVILIHFPVKHSKWNHPVWTSRWFRWFNLTSNPFLIQHEWHSSFFAKWHFFSMINDIIDTKRNLRVEERNLWYVNIECAMWIWHSTLQIEVTKINKKDALYSWFTNCVYVLWNILVDSARDFSITIDVLSISIKFTNSAVRNNQRYKILCRFVDENRIFPYSWNSIPDDLAGDSSRLGSVCLEFRYIRSALCLREINNSFAYDRQTC